VDYHFIQIRKLIMAFEYEYENPETGECETLEIEYTISPYIPACTSGWPDNWTPEEGGECEFNAFNELRQNITNDLSRKVCEEIQELCYTDNLKNQD